MMNVRKRSTFFAPLVGCLAAAVFTFAVSCDARAQAGPEAIYGVISLDVAPDATAKGVALAKLYRDRARNQAGNLGVDLLQEVGWPNRFVIYETWKDQFAYDASEKAAALADLGEKLKPIEGAPLDRRDYHIVSVGQVRAATADSIYTQVHLDVFPPGMAPAVAALKQVAEAARKGPGNLRYDVVQSVKNFVNHFTLYAAWVNRKAFDDYESSADGRRFRDVMGPLLGSPYDDRLYVKIN